MTDFIKIQKLRLYQTNNNYRIVYVNINGVDMIEMFIPNEMDIFAATLLKEKNDDYSHMICMAGVN